MRVDFYAGLNKHLLTAEQCGVCATKGSHLSPLALRCDAFVPGECGACRVEHAESARGRSPFHGFAVRAQLCRQRSRRVGEELHDHTIHDSYHWIILTVNDVI